MRRGTAARRAESAWARGWAQPSSAASDYAFLVDRLIDRATLEKWAGVVGWETLLNRAGTTFRKLPDAAKTGLTEAKAMKLMLEQPSMIKRPVLEKGRTLLVGFSEERYSTIG